MILCAGYVCVTLCWLGGSTGRDTKLQYTVTIEICVMHTGRRSDLVLDAAGPVCHPIPQYTHLPSTPPSPSFLQQQFTFSSPHISLGFVMVSCCFLLELFNFNQTINHKVYASGLSSVANLTCIKIGECS